MAAPLPLEGDGLIENLFHYLWTTDDLGGGPRVSVPPTVIYRGSQPVAWYFTSRKSGRIKRKHRANLTAAHIEHAFTRRKAATDIVAYYLYLPKSESNSPAIEYYDADSLREFLFKRPEIPHSSSPGSVQATGILQQFALPKGARNSTLRAIWSPKLCLLERRVNVHAIHDARFSVYERGVTFEEGGGAEALSRPEPVRGSMLPGMVQQLCERVVDHVTRVSYHKFRIARMVLRLQIDVDDRLWLLWSSSLRLQPPLGIVSTMITPDMPTGEPAIRPLDIVSDAKVPTFAFAQGSGGGPVSLSSTCSPEVDEDPRPGQTRCASCALVVAHRALLPTTYKAVLAHFQQVLKFLRERVNEENHVAIEWPPDERVVQQAGGVGFGILRHLKSVSSSSDDSGGPKVGSGLGQKGWLGRELLVPPVIRYLHPTLRAEDFARHRQDPIFLHKTVGVCERCCLAYADYATASLEANALGIRSSASAPALLRPTREMPKHAEYFDDDPSDPLMLTTNLRSPLARGVRATTSKEKPPATAWKPVPTDDRQQGRFLKYKAGPRSTLHSLPMAPKLPPRIETFEPEDNDALRIPDGILHDDGSPQHEQQQREEAFFRDMYQQKDTVKRGGHALRHILEAADRLSKAKPQHRLAALGDSTQIGQSQSTGALVGAITELKLAKRPGKSPYSIVQRMRDGDGSLSKNQVAGNVSPAKSPQKHESKPSKKKSSKKTQTQSEVSAERARFVSSREKKAAAAHRGYLVAALSDAQVQLEHIESLAALVISAPDIEAGPVEPEQRGRRHRKSNGDEEKEPPGPQQQSIVSQEGARDQEQENHECLESQLDKQEDPIEETGKFELEDKSELQHEEGDAMQTESMENEQLETLDQREDTSGVELLQETGNVVDEQQQENDEENESHNQEPIHEDSDTTQLYFQEQQLQVEGSSLEYEQSEHELVHKPDEIQDQMQEQQSEFCEQEDNDWQVSVQHQEDEAQVEYEDEYEDPYHEQDPHDQEYQQHRLEHDDNSAEFTAQEEAKSAADVLEQAQDLLATAASSDSVDDASDEHEAAQDDEVSGSSNDLSISTPFVFQALENDSNDDAVIAADSDVAAAIPLPLSDEATSAASDE